MRITILALGSRGDVQPFVPLGRALQHAGHSVRIATFASFEPLIRGAGLDFWPVRGDAFELLNRAAQGENLSRKGGLLGMIPALRRSYAELAQTVPDDLRPLRDSDLILNQLPAHLYGGDLAEHLGVRWAIVTVIPLVRTRYQPLIGAPPVVGRLPGGSLLSYRLGEQVGWQLFRRSVNNLRRRWGLPAHGFFGPYERIHRSRVPFLCGFSRHVAPRPPDWGEHVHLTGWWFPEEPDWAPPPDLLRFLDAGPPPVYVGFGSMPVGDPALVTDLIVKAAEMAGCRVVLGAGWARLGGRLPGTFFALDYAPYGWLFPRMAATIHHGGSGTTGFAVSAGVPSLVVPFVFDQPFWGARIARLGVGPEPMPYRRLEAGRLARAMDQLLSDRSMQDRAAALGALIRAEGGTTAAVRIIERL